MSDINWNYVRILCIIKINMYLPVEHALDKMPTCGHSTNELIVNVDMDGL